MRFLLVATAVATVVVLFALVTAALTPGLYGRRVDWKWVRFALVTIVFVGYCLKTYWRARKRLGFWVILFGVLVIHFLGVGYFYYAGSGLPLLLFGPAVALEWALLALGVYRFLDIGPPSYKT
jgi:hypothetical protein